MEWRPWKPESVGISGKSSTNIGSFLGFMSRSEPNPVVAEKQQNRNRIGSIIVRRKL